MKIRDAWFDLRWWWEDRPRWLFPERVKSRPKQQAVAPGVYVQAYNEAINDFLKSRESKLREHVTTNGGGA